MTANPIAIALGDQIHAEISARAMRDIDAALNREHLTPNQNEQMYIEIGIQAGLQAALQTIAEHGWIATR